MEDAVLLANSSPSETDLTFFGDVTSEMGSRHRALGKQGEENRRREVPRSPVSAGTQTVNHSSLQYS